jgi:hypothetical protein
MCEKFVLAKIEKLLETKMNNGEMFTAFDITQALKSDGVKKRHRAIRHDIQRTATTLMWRYNFQRTLADLPGTRARAFVYHPFNTDHNAYLAKFRPAPLAIVNQPPAGVVQKFPDKRATVCIPSRLARTAGFTPGEKVFVFLDQTANILIVAKAQHGQLTGEAKAYTVDKHHNVRVTRSAFERSKLAAPGYFVSVAIDGIAIKPW